MVKKFTIPFASQGDANDIPDALQIDGKVSFTQGFGYDYERPYDDPQAKDIAREDMNGLFKAITSAVGELQTLGASEWSNAISYPKGAIVYHEKDLYISQVDDNQNTPPQDWVSITSIANDSLKKVANLSDLTNKATARNNLGLGSSATLNKTDVLGTSTSLVATQKLVNDTKINLESSKQDKLEFVGGGKVMREGAYGIGGFSGSTVDSSSFVTDEDRETGFYSFGGDGSVHYGNGLQLQKNTRFVIGLTYPIFRVRVNDPRFDIQDYTMYHTSNTSIDSSGFLRVSGNKEAFTKDLVTQSTGSSTTNVMSQKAVTDLVKINTASKMQNGWWKCGDTGVVKQWGRIQVSGESVVTLPISFSTANYSVTASLKSATNSDTAQFDNLKESQFKVTIKTPSGTVTSADIFWLAIGY